jgi:hypothetical protein
MQNIPKSYRYLLALVLILLAFPFVSGFIMSNRIKNKQYTLEPSSELSSKIHIPPHKTLIIDSYRDGLNFYAWWGNMEDSMISTDDNGILNNEYYFQKHLSGDTFSISYLPYLKKFIAAQSNPAEAGKKKTSILHSIISLVGKAPDKIIIRGCEIQVSPITYTQPLTYLVEVGSLSLGILREDREHFNFLSKHYPKLSVGNNHQPDWKSEIVSPATIHLEKHTSLFIKNGYNTAQTAVITFPNTFVNIDHPNAHSQVRWQFSDSTYIHCNKLQEAWFQENFPTTKLIFTLNERVLF